MAITTARTTSPMRMVPILAESHAIIWIPPFQGQLVSGRFLHVDANLLAIDLLSGRAEQQDEEQNDNDDSHHRADAEVTGEKHTQLVDAQADQIGEAALIADGEPESTWRCSSPA